MINIYCRLLGARVGKGVWIDNTAALGEYDLLTFEDGCRVDKALVRGFCVERDGHFRLAEIVIGRNAVINTYTQIAPGANIPEGTVFGPHASSHEQPSPESFVQYNRTVFKQPNAILKFFVGFPIIFLIVFISYIPWLLAIYGMINSTSIQEHGLNSVESVINWFANPVRVGFHIFARMLRVVVAPIFQVFFGIIVKRLMGLNQEGTIEGASQWSLLRRYVNSVLLSQYTLKHAFDVLGTHYEMTSVSYTHLLSCFVLIHDYRLCSVSWGQKSVNAYIGQVPVSIAPTLSCWKLAMTSYLVLDRRYLPQTVSDPPRSPSEMAP